MHSEARAVLDALELKPHPEGGFYRETFRSDERIEAIRDGAVRSASTAIYFLLPSGGFSAWHRVRSDEVWHFYDGDPLELFVISPNGHATRHVLGRALDRGERPQAVVQASDFQAARCLGDRFTLCGCTVAPGFDFADFEMITRGEMLRRFEKHHDIIAALSKE